MLKSSVEVRGQIKYDC